MEIKSIKELEEILSKKQKQLEQLKTEVEEIQIAINILTKYKPKLAIEKGICPFPNSCNERNTCTKDSCHYDECINGYCFRRS